MKNKNAEYGKYRYRIMLSKSDCFFIMADRIEITSNGDLIAYGQYRREDSDTVLKKEDEIILLGLNTNNWLSFYAASCISDDMVCED